MKKVHTEPIALLTMPKRIEHLKTSMLQETRFVSIEQAKIITRVYKENEQLPKWMKRAKALSESLRNIGIKIDDEELIVGNRTCDVRAGVVFPESGISWLDREIETLPYRDQDKFEVRAEDIRVFREEILPYWKGKTLEDHIYQSIGDELSTLEYVVKINQKDHAQGHICPNTEKWLQHGPQGIAKIVRNRMERESDEDKLSYYASMIEALDGASAFMQRYAALAHQLAEKQEDERRRLELFEIERICTKLSKEPAVTFYEALQSVWFLFVILQMESNASSFSPGRMDQYLYPYFQKDYETGRIDLARALELIESLWLKFNQIVYLRNTNSAKYFAGFPIGFNVALGGQTTAGEDASNELSFLFLKALEHIQLPQPNLSARLFAGSSQELLRECARVIGKGIGMPQLFNDEAVIPALMNKGYSREDAINYAIVGCVELTTHGNSLGWSDAAMCNLVKILELTLNDGICLLSGKQIGLKTGSLIDYDTYEDFEAAYQKQIGYFVDRMIPCCELVERKHAELLPSPFLSTVIDDCIEKGIDVTAGGAKYNLSGIQAIQPANVADSLAVLRAVYSHELGITKSELLKAIRADYEGMDVLRNTVLYKVPKYGNDVEWVDKIADKWIAVFDNCLKKYTNIRGGIYHTGMYTVSAHVPMGQKVGATVDGRQAMQPLADGGMSAVYGRDMKGPTSLLKSVSRIDSMMGSNGTLLNMKFLPDIFESEEDLDKFVSLLKAFVKLKIIHVQFNVLRGEQLIEAQKYPERYRNLTVRVAGYTAYFTELARDLQNEIIARTSYGGT